MTYCRNLSRIALVPVLTMALCACQTVSMPKLDLVKSPEFAEDAKNIATNYPKVGEAPLSPDDIRSAGQWDRDAKALQSLRTQPRAFPVETNGDNGAAGEKFDELQAKVHAYKKDDPAGGVKNGFPNYQPRR